MPFSCRPEQKDKNTSLDARTGAQKPVKALGLETAPYRGARDFYPQEQRVHNWVFGSMTSVVELFGYEAYNAPMLEPLHLYAAKSGRELVEEQLYTLTDRGGRELAIRPEMTPSLARMVAARIHELTFPLRWYSTPNLWRYERPQRGRTREHWQLNVDLIGVPSLEGELEVLEVAIRIMQKFGATPQDCQINFSNRKFLAQYLEQETGLNASQAYNVMKVVDRRAKLPEAAYLEMLGSLALTSKQIDQVCLLPDLSLAEIQQKYADRYEGAREIAALWDKLERHGLSDYCRVNIGIVRGLDYYTGTVFEMYDLNPQNKRALFGGGRYDDLIALFSDRPMPAVGFGLGDVTITDFLTTHRLLPSLKTGTSLIFVLQEAPCRDLAHALAAQLRAAGVATEVYPNDEVKLGKQLKYAKQRSIPYVAILGGEERASRMATLKNMLTGEQSKVPFEELVSTMLSTKR